MTAESRFGLTDEQAEQATKAIEIDDVDTLRSIVNEKIKESPQLKDVLFLATQSGRPGQVSTNPSSVVSLRLYHAESPNQYKDRQNNQQD